MARPHRIVTPIPTTASVRFDRDARLLLNILADAHARLDERDRRDGTYLPPNLRRRHTPVHHEAWHQ